MCKFLLKNCFGFPNGKFSWKISFILGLDPNLDYTWKNSKKLLHEVAGKETMKTQTKCSVVKEIMNVIECGINIPFI